MKSLCVLSVSASQAILVRSFIIYRRSKVTVLMLDRDIEDFAPIGMACRRPFRQRFVNGGKNSKIEAKDGAASGAVDSD